MIAVGTPIDLDALRLRDEFLSMPGLVITVAQAARLLGVRVDHAAAILAELEHESFVQRDETGAYRRGTPLAFSRR